VVATTDLKGKRAWECCEENICGIKGELTCVKKKPEKEKLVGEGVPTQRGETRYKKRNEQGTGLPKKKS